MSQHTYIRNQITGGWDIDALISHPIEVVFVGKKFDVSCFETTVLIDFVIDLTQEEITTLSGIVETYRTGATARVLAEAKSIKIRAIDARTDDLITAGFQYQGMWFEASLEAQCRMLGLLIISLHTDTFPPASIFPVKWNSKDDSGVLILTQPSDVIIFVTTCIATYRAYIDAGTVIKDQVRAATTVEQVWAIVDPR